MFANLAKRLSDFNLYDVLKVMAYIIICLYFFTYIYGFEMFNMRDANSMESDDFSIMMEVAMREMGGAFVWGTVMILTLTVRRRVLSCVLTIMTCMMQVIYLGIPGFMNGGLFEIPQIFYIESINLQLSLKRCLETAISNGADIAIEHCTKAIQSVVLIQISLVFTIILATFILCRIKKDGHLEKASYKETKIKKSKSELLLQANNLFLIIMLVMMSILYYLCMKNAFDMNGYAGHYRQFVMPDYWDWSTYISIFRDMVVPFVFFLVIVVSKLIKTKRYILMILAYIVYGLALKNVTYIILDFTLTYLRYDIWEFYFYDECIKIALMVVILMTIWKYVISNVVKK